MGLGHKPGSLVPEPMRTRALGRERVKDLSGPAEKGEQRCPSSQFGDQHLLLCLLVLGYIAILSGILGQKLILNPTVHEARTADTMASVNLESPGITYISLDASEK